MERSSFLVDIQLTDASVAKCRPTLMCTIRDGPLDAKVEIRRAFAANRVRSFPTAWVCESIDRIRWRS
jgi:hypothetical protein